ncbi:LLM class flavin-dependent oxidoreductase [Natrinema halophilum]|uniref:LLM class flavin-dependent oxidoreductase n=1 Tax=Natrinema halophilum TaxID=1699371 RepID=UPI001F39538C|nr:LLM class flavin-dependent oxidoreductase [Natrinema halophilum]UHQ96373.1 LLM class flavin-dependent oxidoreductase [Natrinema halophilum]
MRFGLYLLNHAPPRTNLSTLFQEVADQTRVAQEMDFDMLTTGQHYLADYAYLQPIPLLSRLTSIAGSMTVGPAVLLLPLHHPIQVAENVATLSALADDVVLGVGAGYRDVEFQSFSIPKAQRSKRLEEGIAVIKQLWTNESVSFDGEHITVDDVSLHSQSEQPVPIWVAAHSQPAVERAARIGDTWIVGPHSTLTETAELVSSTYQPTCEEYGADASVSIIREAFVASTTEEAEQVAKEYLAPRYKKYVDWGQNKSMADESELSQQFQALSDDRFLIGTPADICSELERYQDTLDVDHVLFRTQWPGLSHERTMESLRLLGDEVLPHV